MNNIPTKQREYEVLAILFKRYEDKIKQNQANFNNLMLPEKCQYSHLLRLAHEAHSNALNYPTDKLHRWLGFIQGVLSVVGIINVDEERDFTRPLLHSYHNKKPETFQ